MIDIKTKRGDIYSYDEGTGQVYKNGALMSSSQIEPIFSEGSLAGFHLISSSQIVSVLGNINPLDNTDNI